MREKPSQAPEEFRMPSTRERTRSAELSFFGDVALSSGDLERAHPFGPETADETTVKHRREVAHGIFDRLSRSRVTKPLLRMIAILTGVGGIAFGAMREKGGNEEPQEEITTQEAGEEYELRRIIYDELLDSGEVAFESEARHGRQSWTPDEAFEYGQFKSLLDKFEYLHKDNKDIMGALKSSRGRLENYGSLFDLMSEEYVHSSLPFEFSKDAVLDAAEVIPKIEEKEALELFRQFSSDLAKKMGLRYARELASGMVEALPQQHAVVKEIGEKGWLAPEVGEWLKGQKDNFVLFDQVTGRIEMYHREKDSVVLLDVFPGNGGPANGVAWEPGLPGHLATRTPDGSFTFDRALEKKSPSWRNSWVGNNAELRWSDEAHTNVDYKDQDGSWRRLTGSDAEFVVYGAPQKPFREKKGSVLYREASHKASDGTRTPPKEFQVADALEDVLEKNGGLRETWGKNDFGPLTIRMKDQKGELMSVFFHSSPSDGAPDFFLDSSHGCIHMKPDDVDMLAHYLARGSEIRISSVDAMSIIAMN
jgi:hypothetical protein